uniref:Uncharacterized protein n=1 Tax=uncultured Desulfobacterium sp. TaxID=201089 RepID=E1YF57_9BACT|nr:hypothetical protein N47_J01820 [uncultured Desulfobacterium sp.]
MAVHREHLKHEKALINEINRILSETKTKIPLVPNYRGKLKKPVLLALETIAGMTEQIPGPISLDPALWGNSPVLKTVFTSRNEFSRWFNNCRSVQNAFKQNNSDKLFGLLVTQYKEKISFGVELIGEIVQKDVLQQSVSFEEPIIVVPHPDMATAQKELQHRILVLLFTHELDKIADLKLLKEEFERQQDILEIKLKLSEENKNRSAKLGNKNVASEAKQIINDINRKIEVLGRNPDTPESHLRHVTEVLMDIDRHLKMIPLTIRLNNMGILVKASSSGPFDEISFAECTYKGSPKKAVIWVQINRSSLNMK